MGGVVVGRGWCVALWACWGLGWGWGVLRGKMRCVVLWSMDSSATDSSACVNSLGCCAGAVAGRVFWRLGVCRLGGKAVGRRVCALVARAVRGAAGGGAGVVSVLVGGVVWVAGGGGLAAAAVRPAFRGRGGGPGNTFLPVYRVAVNANRNRKRANGFRRARRPCYTVYSGTSGTSNSRIYKGNSINNPMSECPHWNKNPSSPASTAVGGHPLGIDRIRFESSTSDTTTVHNGQSLP